MKNNKLIIVTVLTCIFCVLPTTAKNPIVGTLLKEAVNAASTANKMRKQIHITKAEDQSRNISISNAQPSNEEITLTVSSDGTTKEEATKNALRSAIEQAYGAFVSANTTILNDELVKDEVVTVSNGSIKEYKEISAVETGTGEFLVTLSATVSLPNLISYAKSHGSDCEFAGNTFAMNERIRDIQYKNAQKVLSNLTDIVKNSKDLFDYKLTLKEPILRGDTYTIPGTVWILGNQNTLNVIESINNTIYELCNQLKPTYTQGPGAATRKQRLEEALNEISTNPTNLKMPELLRDSWSFDLGDSWKFLSNTWFNGYPLLADLSMNFQINDNLSSPSKTYIVYDGHYDTPQSPRLRWPSIYIDNRKGSIKKPYKEEKFANDYNNLINHLYRNDYQYMYRNIGIDCDNTFPNTFSIIPYEDNWAIELVYFKEPMGKIPIEIVIPKSEIGKYTNFSVEPKK
ncbi:MAG: hypothetical protein K2L11_10265 [Muribaculaceae bacterium]|nr:hypothetical protein [Muribaculaceae bacterium]